LFVVLFFAPQTIAEEESQIEINAPLVYGIAYINGTLKNPHSFFEKLTEIFEARDITARILLEGDFIEGKITPRFGVGEENGIRYLTVGPGEDCDYAGADIRGMFCMFDNFSPIVGSENEYRINGTIYGLFAEPYAAPLLS